MGMEKTNEHPEAVAQEHAPDRPFPKSAKKVERIAQQSKGLFDDVRDWIDLKIKLTELEFREKIKARQDDIVTLAVVGFLGVMALVFLLVAAALGLGAWLGHPAWGFLIVTGILSGIAGLLYWAHFSRGKKKAVKPEPMQKKLAAPLDQKKLSPGSADTETAAKGQMRQIGK